MGSSDGLNTKYLYINKTNTTNIPMLNTANGAIQSTLTEAEFETVFIKGLDADSIFSIGTNIGGWLINYNVKVWLPEAMLGLILL